MQSVSYADILKYGKNKIAITRNNTHNHKKDMANQSQSGVDTKIISPDTLSNAKGIPKPIEELLVRFKILNVSSVSKEELCMRLFDENQSLNVEIEKIDQVKGRHRMHNNAIILVNFQITASLEAYPFLYEERRRSGYFSKYINIRYFLNPRNLALRIV